jgi:hypothetical protein
MIIPVCALAYMVWLIYTGHGETVRLAYPDLPSQSP